MRALRSLPLFRVWILVAVVFLGSLPLRAQNGLVISEILADNYRTIRDDFGDSSDFIELYNGSWTTVDLENYSLTDQLATKPHQWRFPKTNLISGQHLLVWASGRDRRVPGQPLHTNFKLDRNGEEIWLVEYKVYPAVVGFTFGPQSTEMANRMMFSTNRPIAIGLMGLAVEI